jgi:hypothetical protein
LHAPFDIDDIAGTVMGAIESLDYIDAVPGLVAHPRPNVVPRGSVIAVTGWAVASRKNDAPSAVTVVLDRHREHAAECGLARTDVAVTRRTAENIGYRCTIPTDDIPAGVHELRVFALGPNGGWFYAAQMPFRIYHGADPRLAPHKRGIRVKVEYAGELHAGEVGNASPIAHGRPARIAGWAFDPVTLTGPAGVIATDEVGRNWIGACGIERSDVGAMLGVANNGLGFEVIVPTEVLERGRHVVRLAAFDADGRCYGNSEEVTLNVAGPVRPFPLTARIRTTEPPFGATLARIDDDALPRSFPVRGRNPVVEAVRGDEFVLQGWAIAANGDGADEVFVEIAPSDYVVPPRRYASRAGFHLTDDAIERALIAPVEDAWFSCPFDTNDLAEGDYAVSIVVVDPGRRTAARTRLATLRVSEPAGDAKDTQHASRPRRDTPIRR